VATVWRELLSIERIAVTDNFLDLGGHSLLIMQAIAKLEARTGKRRRRRRTRRCRGRLRSARPGCEHLGLEVTHACGQIGALGLHGRDLRRYRFLELLELARELGPQTLEQGVTQDLEVGLGRQLRELLVELLVEADLEPLDLLP
jgi:hypothetical protein